MTSIPIHTPSPPGSHLWRSAQAIGLVATGGLVAGLFVAQDVALFVLWNVLIPLVPLSLMVSPLIWRNVCPLASLNLAWQRSGSGKLTNGLATKAAVVSMVLLALLVPARRFLFNTDGPVLAMVIVAVGVLALVLGFGFDTKAGFCNAICPVLPVERLYGQAPLLRLPNARCGTCSQCTTRGCIDLAPEKSVAQTLGSARQSARWLMTPFGVFAAAFPGFIISYYTTADVALSSAGAVYGHMALWSAGSYLLVALVVGGFRLPSAPVLVVIGGLALGLYYWFAVDVVLTAFGVTDSLWPMVGRGLALLAIAIWLAEALPKALPRGARA
jgi:hypothetical protein